MESFTKEELKDRIKKLRKKASLTQLKLAEKVHVTDKAVSKWETGEGNPEITILINLASIFGVSLDYLLTGKEQEKETVVMNKLELCCKEDSVSLFNEIASANLKGKDENDKTILDYIEKYNSKNVYQAFVEKFKPSVLISANSRNDFKFFNFQRLLGLFFKYDDVHSLEAVSFFKHNLCRDQFGYIISNNTGKNNIYDEKNVETMIKSVSNDSRIIDLALSIHNNEIVNNVSNWQAVYTNILYYALLNDRDEIVKKAVSTIIEINHLSMEEYELKSKTAGYDNKNCYRISTSPSNIISGMNYTPIYNYAVIATPVKTLELLIDKGYLDDAKKLNDFNESFNAKTISTGMIQAKFLEKEGNVSQDDIFIASCMEYGIVNIDKLLVCNNLNIIKKAFANHPICFKDMLTTLSSLKKYKELYEFTIDNKFESLAQAILLINTEEYGKANLEKQIDTVAENVYISGNKFDVNRTYYIKKQNYSYWDSNKANPRITTQEVKDVILKELTLKLDKEREICGLTRQYFEELLKNNDFELLIIKLCVKLEAILKYDLRYEGTLEAMIEKYSDQHLNWEEDDGWGYMTKKCDSRTIEILNNLRIKRNSIVHSEVTKVDLALDDLRYCIEYVCNLNKEA